MAGSHFDSDNRQIHIDPVWVFRIGIGLVVLVSAVIFFSTAWVTIEPEEVGVVRRFGRYDRRLDPGLHFVLPFGMDNVTKVPVKRQLKQEFGFETRQAGQRTEYDQTDHRDVSQMLTGDLNVANIEWVTQYRVSNPMDYLFKVRAPTTTFRDMNEAVMREIVGDHTINEVLTTGRTGIALLVQAELQELCNQYEMGITIDQVILQDVNPPDPVKPAFNEVNQAQQEKERMINEAKAAYNKVIPRARGDAEKVVAEAEGYATERVNRAEGEANRFRAVFEEFQRSPEVTRQRIYLETMEDVLGQVGKKIIIDEQASGILPLLNLNQETGQ